MAHGLNKLEPEDRSKETELSVQLSLPSSLSLPDAELKQQRITHVIKKRKRSVSKFLDCSALR